MPQRLHWNLITSTMALGPFSLIMDTYPTVPNLSSLHHNGAYQPVDILVRSVEAHPAVETVTLPDHDIRPHSPDMAADV